MTHGHLASAIEIQVPDKKLYIGSYDFTAGTYFNMASEVVRKFTDDELQKFLDEHNSEEAQAERQRCFDKENEMDSGKTYAGDIRDLLDTCRIHSAIESDVDNVESTVHRRFSIAQQKLLENENKPAGHTYFFELNF